jgi:hypothetical protein
MKLKLALFGYCIVAVLALVVWLVSVIAAGNRVGAERRQAETALAEATEKAETQRGIVFQMEDVQRNSRADLDPLDALKLSARVQEAQAELQARDTELAAAEQRHTQLREKHEALLSRIVPIIALLMLHLVGGFMLAPRRGELATARTPAAD